MSDFIYSNKSIEEGKLTKEIQAIYHQDIPLVEEFHGKWGSLAISQNFYNGFQTNEGPEHICVVIGGPVLYFRDNRFLNSNSSMAGTKAIFERWHEGLLEWDKDLSGPFAVLIIDKRSSEAICITDLMSFIPVYTYQHSATVMLSTHVDVLASASGQQSQIDVVSKVDFILHGFVTYPYTVYETIRQLAPGTEHFSKGEGSQSQPYWIPEEKDLYESITKAAEDLREGLQRYVKRITSEVNAIAQFISGGEDSRMLSGILRNEYAHDAFVFLDQVNREGEVARKAAHAYGVNFKLALRDKQHYLDIIPSSTKLVGSGSQYFHAHTFGFHKSCQLYAYQAVFGGLFSDALLKGARIKKMRGSGRFPFLPQVKRNRYSAGESINNSHFTREVLSELTRRRQDHLKYVSSFRNESAEEWFELWPSSMNMNIPNLHANRRLFRSYEPFMANDVVKISAAVPQHWKLNRRLFHKVAKPWLKPTKWLLHGEGRLPYFSWHINLFVQFSNWVYQEAGKKVGLIKGNQGPWAAWDELMNSPEWKRARDTYSNGIEDIESALNGEDVKALMDSNELDYVQQINLMQTLYSSHNRNM